MSYALRQLLANIGESRKSPDPLAPSTDPEELRRVLNTLTSEQISSFEHEFYQALIDLNHWNLWGAGYVMTGGMSEDSFHYFRSWIIGKGPEAYDAALKSPDDLGRFATDGEEEFDNELLEYVAIEVLETRGLPDPREDFTEFADDAPKGKMWEEEEVYGLFPQLAARYERNPLP